MNQRTDRKDVIILGSRVNSTTQEEVLKAIGRYLEEKTKFSLVTPNPEIILLANKDKNLQKTINDATFSVPDGIGLKLADLDLKIIHGRKLFLEVCSLVNQRKGRIYLLGGGMVPTTAQKAKDILEKEYSDISFHANSGPMLDLQGEPKTPEDKKVENEVISQINQFAPDVLFIAFGAPKQEKWMAKWLPKLKVGGAMAIGGTLDYIAGNYPLPPDWISALEMEWLWRLLTQKGRYTRIVKAVFMFPLTLLFSKTKK